MIEETPEEKAAREAEEKKAAEEKAAREAEEKKAAEEKAAADKATQESTADESEKGDTEEPFKVPVVQTDNGPAVDITAIPQPGDDKLPE